MKSTAAQALAAFCVATLCQVAAPLAAVHFEGPGSTALNLGFLVQPQLDITSEQKNTPDRDARFNPFLRRARIYAFGQVTPRVSFFFQTDIPNVGRNGDWTPSLQMQDAFVEFDLHPAFVLDAGLVYVPFSHAGMQAADNLLGVDYPSIAITPPSPVFSAGGTSTFPNNFNGRDLGLMGRGMLLAGHLEYRVALTQGVAKFLGDTNLNPRAWPRATGRLTYNFFEAEATPDITGYFYGGSYLEDRDGTLISPKRILSVGGSASYQREAVLSAGGVASDYKGYDIDLFLDLPLMDGTHAINGQVNFYYYDQASVFGPAIAVFSEAGYRIGRIEPTLGWEYLHYDNDFLGGEVNYWRVGANYWFAGHVANVKFDAGARTPNQRTNEVVFAARLETQVSF